MKIIQKILMLMMVLSSLILATTIKTWKAEYPTGDSAWIKLENKPNNHEDWVGIYPAGSSSDWENVVQWKWAREPSPAEDPGDWYKFESLADGNYEARFFLNNTYAIEEAISFAVGNALTISTTKNRYAISEDITVQISNQAQDNRNWVGIYPQGASNDWDNVVVWQWTEGQNTVLLDGVDEGNYEARLFYENSFNLEAKTAFRVAAKVDYGKVGSFLDDVVIDEHEKYVVYKPVGHLDNAPVVLFVSYATVLGEADNPDYPVRLEGLMKFLASKGICVIGAKKNPSLFASRGVIQIFEDAISETLALHPTIDVSKLGVIGQSRGGGQVFKIMQELKLKNYGGDKSFVIPLDGSFSHEMSKNDLETFQADTLFIQYGGYIGNITDPRRTLSIHKLLSNNINKGFVAIHTNIGHSWAAHSYSYGDLNNILTKTKLVQSIGAMVAYEFFNDPADSDAYNEIFNEDKTDETIQNIINVPLKEVGDYPYDCDGSEAAAGYYELKFNYCTEYLN